MRESVLRDFFLGHIPPAALARDVKGSTKQLTPIESVVEIEDMQGEFAITRPMLVSLCDAVLSGHFPPHELSAIGFTLLASDSFAWDDDLMSEVINDWSCPEINYALTLANVIRFRNWLLGSEPYPSKPRPEEPQKKGRVISMTKKVAVRGQHSKNKN
jgi:hypothetical protein